MNYIVVDLEWNQPLSYNSRSFKEIGDKLLFEIIEIGATKLNEHFEVVGTFRQTIKPTYYTRVHPRIRRITNLSTAELATSPNFEEAHQKFCDFVGENAVFISWGAEDVSVYAQNLNCFNIVHDPLVYYNAQKMFAVLYKTPTKQPGLKTAMDSLGIEEDETLPFHDALNDAYYTAKVLEKMKDRKQILHYPQAPKKLVHQSKFKAVRGVHQVLTVKHALQSSLLQKPTCPACKEVCDMDINFLPQSPFSYIALAKCKTHGYLYLQARFGRLRNKNTGLCFNVIPAMPEHKQYIRAKMYQNAVDPMLNHPNLELPPMESLDNFPFEND